MGLFRALFNDLTQSRAEKVNAHVEQLRDETRVAITTIGRLYQPAVANVIAQSCRNLAIELRGDVGCTKAYNLYYALKQRNDPNHAGAWLASRLILADQVVKRAGGDGIQAESDVREIQKMIAAFFVSVGVEPWEGNFGDDGFAALNPIG